MSTLDTQTPLEDKRHDPVEHYYYGGSGLGDMRPCKDGDWVPYDFALALERRHAALREALEMIAGGLPSRFVADSQIAEVALQADDEAGKEMK